MSGYRKTGTLVAISLSMPGKHRRPQEISMRYFDEQDKIRAKTTMARLGSWLGSRPMESWGFFVAGFIIARIIF